MALTLILSGLWLLVALAACRLPGPAALRARTGLMALGIPLLGFITYAQGPLPGLAGLLVGTVVLGLHRLPRLRLRIAEGD